MKRIRIATVGVGRFGVFHLQAFKQLEKFSSVQLAAAAELDPKKQKVIRDTFLIPVYEDYEKMIENEELDAISIATQDHLHQPIAMYALSKGLHVFVEKPLDISTEGAFEMVDVAQVNDLLIQVDFHKRYDPYHIEIKQLIEQGKFGDFLYGYCYMEDKIIVPRDWFKDWVHKTSPLWFLGTHFIDLISWLINSKAISAYAKGHKKKLKSMGLDTYDSVQSMITFENEAVITFDNSWILPEQFSSIVNQGIRIIGTEGIVEADSKNRGTSSCFTSETGVRNHNSGFMQIIKGINDEVNYEGYGITSIQHFAKNVEYLSNGGTLNELKGTYPSGWDGYEVTKVIRAIEISLESGESVLVNSVDGVKQDA